MNWSGERDEKGEGLGLTIIFTFFRLLPNPIRVKYVAYRKDGDDKKYFTSMTNGPANPRVYLDPFSEASALFSGAEILLDHYNISAQLPQQGQLRSFYDAAQRSFMKSSDRAKYFGNPHCIADDTTRFELGDPDTKAALASMEFDSESDPSARSVQLSMAGVPFLGCSRNHQLAALQGKKPPLGSSFLPPQTLFTCR